jgi:hypothetical protein
MLVLIGTPNSRNNQHLTLVVCGGGKTKGQARTGCGCLGSATKWETFLELLTRICWGTLVELGGLADMRSGSTRLARTVRYQGWLPLAGGGDSPGQSRTVQDRVCWREHPVTVLL